MTPVHRHFRAVLAALPCILPLWPAHAGLLYPPEFLAVGGGNVAASSLYPFPAGSVVQVTGQPVLTPDHAEVSWQGGTSVGTQPVQGLQYIDYASASGSGSAFSSAGLLRAQVAASASAGETATSLSGAPPVDHFAAQAQLGSTASFTDHVLVTAPGLSDGTPVQLQLFYKADTTVFADGPSSGAQPRAVAVFSVDGPSVEYIQRFDSTAHGFGLFLPWQEGKNPHTLFLGGDYPEAFISTKVGDVLTLSAQLSVGGGASALPNGFDAQLNASYLLDASHTAGMWLSAPDGVILASASGHDYTKDPTLAVPEPSSVAMSGLGAILLSAGLAWRRRVSPG